MKKTRKKKNTAVLVAVSALAIKASYGGSAFAQLKITCSQGIRFGNNIACANGALTVAPTGATATTGGCLLNTVAPLPGQCILSTAGTGPKKSVKVGFTANFITITNGATNVKVDKLMMQSTGATTAATKATFSPTAVLNTVTINIGARMNYSNMQAIGSYVGNISITAN